MQQKFIIELRHLTDPKGRPVGASGTVEFQTAYGGSVDEALNSFVGLKQAELLGNVLKFPGLTAVATMRSNDGVFTVNISPASQEMPRS